jgi:hypothetical protein
MQTRLRCPQRDAEGLGDRALGHPHVVMQDQDGALFRTESTERTFQLISIRDEPALVGDAPLHRRRQLDLDRPATTPPNGVEASVDGQSVEPAIEPVGIAQTPQVTPGSDIRLLERVSGEIGIPEDEAGDAFQVRDGRADERSEGVMIARARSLDEFPLVHVHLS